MILVVVAGLVTLLIFNINNYINATNRLKDLKDITNLKTYFENYLAKKNNVYTNIESSFKTKIDMVINFFNNFKIKGNFQTILANIFNALYTILLIVLNVGVNVFILSYILIKNTIDGTQEAIKFTRLARIYIFICKFLNKAKIGLFKLFKSILKLLKKNKKRIFILLLLISISTGFLYNFIIELFLFIVSYFYHVFNLESQVVLISIIKFVITFIYPIISHVPSFIWIATLIILIFFDAILRAKLKLKRNHKRLKEFDKEDLTQTTFINGAPGTGKTLLNVSLSLASEENYIDYLTKLNDRGTFLISNYAIFSPYYNEYSKIFNFDYMRKNIKADIYPLEEYIVISLSELDKEYNSHDDMKAVGADGAATFFSTVSHDLKRHTKIFCDYQLKDQVPLRIRGNAEYFIHIKKRKKKYPFLLLLYYAPFRLLNKLVNNLILRYETKKKRINKHTYRQNKQEYKRNDYSLIYAILRNSSNKLSRICSWFEKYAFFKLNLIVSQEDNRQGIKKTVNINLCDLDINNQKLYDSTFLSFAYEQKKNYEFKDLENYTNLTPSIDELNKCNSKFYNKINN